MRQFFLSRSTKAVLIAFFFGGIAGTMLVAKELLAEFHPSWEEPSKFLLIAAAAAAFAAMASFMMAVIFFLQEGREAIETGNRLEDEAAAEAEKNGEFIP